VETVSTLVGQLTTEARKIVPGVVDIPICHEVRIEISLKRR
jgi:hypothetical protein